MNDVLVGSPLLTLFLVVALGSALGAIRLGPVRFGAAGALAITASRVLGLDPGITGGMFAGMLTATPALAAATTALDGTATPAVGYAIAYPVGVLVTMLVLTLVVRRPLPGGRDPEPLAAAGLLDITVEVEHPMLVSQIPGIAVTPGRSDGLVRMSYLLRDGRMRVALPEDALERGDHLVLVGIPDAVREAADALGHRVSAISPTTAPWSTSAASCSPIRTSRAAPSPSCGSPPASAGSSPASAAATGTCWPCPT
jgi:uncharacterized transporter YbjL